MAKTDDELVRQFMQQQKIEVADNGFTRRVMHSLPRVHQWGFRLFNLFCTAVCLMLFYLLNGVELLWNALRESLLTAAQHLSENFSLPTFGLVTLVLLALAVEHIIHREW